MCAIQMTWEKVWRGKRKKEKPNRLRLKPTIAFRSNLHPETLGYIRRLGLNKKKSDFINQAIEQRFFLLTNKRFFLRRVLTEDYELCRFLLRKIGRNK